jgi:hypothetical protein
MGVETALAAIVFASAAVSAGTTMISAKNTADAQRQAEQEAQVAKRLADIESAKLAAEAEAEATRLSNIEAETKKKAVAGQLARQTATPGTISTSFAGLTAPANTFKKKLLGQ